MAGISSGAVRAQLKKILASPEFISSDRLCQFLRFVVELTLDGQSSRIKQYTIGVEAMGYDADFNPQTNPSVRVHARQLRRALQIYYMQHNKDPIQIVIPNGTYIPSFISSEVAETVSTSVSLSEARDNVPSSQKGLNDLVNQENRPDLKDMSLALLPFEDQAQDDEYAYLASGLTECFVAALSRFTDFEVIGPLSKLGTKYLDAQEIGSEYGVRFVLQGAVRKLKQIVRISVRLNETSRGQTLWAEIYDYDDKSLPLQEIEDDVIGRIVASIADNSGVMPRRLLDEGRLGSRRDSVITDAVLRYYYATSSTTPEATTRALKALREAHEHDSTHVTILAMLADMSAQTFSLGMNDESILVHVEKIARQALSLNRNHQLAHWVIAWVYYLRFQSESCLKELDIVLSLNSNYAILLNASGFMLAMIGDWDRGLSLLRKALHLNPHYPGYSRFAFFLDHYRHRDYENALREASNITTPEFFIDPLSRASALGQLSRREEARQALDELITLVPDFHSTGKKQLRLWAFREENVDLLWEGLIKAGLKEKGVGIGDN